MDCCKKGRGMANIKDIKINYETLWNGLKYFGVKIYEHIKTTPLLRECHQVFIHT